MKRDVHGCITVNVYKLVSDGIEAPIRLGINRAFKYSANEPSDEDRGRLEDSLHNELMIWFCDTFRFDGDSNGN